jgi:hypothetical protein
VQTYRLSCPVCAYARSVRLDPEQQDAGELVGQRCPVCGQGLTVTCTGQGSMR